MMILRTLALAAMAATSIGAQAAPLTTYSLWDNNPAYIASGLTGVKFNVVTENGVTVAMGAHGYKNDINLPNNGTDTFYGKTGTYPGAPDRANWSFDFAVDMRGRPNCLTCTVQLLVDTDPTGGVTPFDLFNNAPAQTGMNSWNMEMGFMTAALGGYDFNPFTASSTQFTLRVLDGTAELASSTITVNVPEPGSLALAGIALAGLAGLRRCKA